MSGWVFGYWGVSGEGLQVHIEMTSCRHTEVLYANGAHSAAQQAVFNLYEDLGPDEGAEYRTICDS